MNPCRCPIHYPTPVPPPVKNKRARGIEVVASEWRENGDHPDDHRCEREDCTYAGGKVVRHYDDPSAPGDRKCERCGYLIRDHGWIDNMDSDYTVCPGDWIVTDARGHYHPLAPDTFKALFSPVDDYEPTSPDIARERSSSTIELPVYVSVGERGEAQQAGTVTVRVNV